MSLGKISTLGERLDLELHQGASLLPVRHTLKNPDGTLVNLTGCTPRGQIRKKALDATVVATFAMTLAPVPTDGWYEFSLTDEQTQAIPCGDKITDQASTYEYDIELEFATGEVRCTFFGIVRVHAGATRP
jgi:hypothetical protein